MSNLGYGADQVDGMKLCCLLEAVQTAIAEWGADTEVVLHQTNNRYGAKTPEEAKARRAAWRADVEKEGRENGNNAS